MIRSVRELPVTAPGSGGRGISPVRRVRIILSRLAVVNEVSSRANALLRRTDPSGAMLAVRRVFSGLGVNNHCTPRCSPTSRTYSREEATRPQKVSDWYTLRRRRIIPGGMCSDPTVETSVVNEIYVITRFV